MQKRSYEIIQFLSQCSENEFTKIYLARWTGECVRNLVSKNDIVIIKHCTGLKHIHREIANLKLLMEMSAHSKQDFFSKMIAVDPNDSGVNLVLQYGGEDLHTHCLKNVSWTKQPATIEKRIRKVSYMASYAFVALSRLHGFHIAHGDIKPENIVFDTQTQKARLIDFESSFKVDRDVQREYAHTPTFTHPLFLDKVQPCTPFENDLWGFGQTVFCLYVGSSMFDHTSITEQRRRQMVVASDLRWHEVLSDFIPEHLKTHPSFSSFVQFVNCMCCSKYPEKPQFEDIMLLQSEFLCYWKTHVK